MIKATRKIFKVSELVPADYNPRKINKKSLKGLEKSLSKFGYLQDIIVNTRENKNKIVGGHQRLVALGLEPQEEIECTIVDLSDLQEKALNVALNNRHTSGEYDSDGLEKILGELKDGLEDFDDLNFDDLAGEFDFNFDEEPLGDGDNIPELVDEPVIKLGDLIEMGGHRVLCGDSTSKTNVERLMDGKKCDLVFADPPYGIDVVQGSKVGGGGDPNNGGYEYGGAKNTGKVGGKNIAEGKIYSKIKGDEPTDTAKQFYQMCLEFDFKNIVLWGGNYFTDFLYPSRCWIVWDKQMTGNFSEAEIAWTSFTKGGISVFKFLWNGLSREGNRKDELKSRVHPTQKPVGLFADIFKRFDGFKTIYDGFLGSGTTLIACEKTNRKCYGMELDEKYCQVIIQRWCDYTEKTEIKINGETVDWNEYKASLT